MADRVLTVRVTGDTTGLGRSFSKASHESKNLGDSLQHHVARGFSVVGKAAGIAGGIIGISYVAAVTDSVKAAADAQVEQARLSTAVKNAGLSWKRSGKQIEETEQRLATMSGFTLPDLEQAMSKLVITTGNSKDAFTLQSAAMDLSRARGMSLQQTSVIMSKLWNGNVTSLTRLGIAISKSTVNYDRYMASTTHATVAGKAAAKALDLIANRQSGLAALQAKYGGQWKSYAGTATGALDRIRADVQLLEIRFGKLLLPYIVRFSTWMVTELPTISKIAATSFHIVGTAITGIVTVGGNLLDFYKAHSTEVKATAAALAILVGGLEIYLGVQKAIVIATKLWTAAQIVLDAVMAANPFAIAVIAAAALAVLFVELWHRSGTFRTVVKSVLHDVQVAFGAVTGFIHDHWQGVAGFIEHRIRNVWTVISTIYGFIRDHWRTILGVMTGGLSIAVQFIVKHFDTIRSAFGHVVGFIRDRWGNLKTVFSAFVGWVDKYVITPIKHIIAWAKRAIRILEQIVTLGYSGKGGTPASGGRGMAPGTTPSSANQRLGQQMMTRAGFASNQWGALQSLWTQESGWSNTAYNASSGATGIPQALPYSKMPRAAWLPSQGGSASPSAQIGWGLGYIRGRYGSPAGAWAHEQRFNWYDKGGVVPGRGPKMAVVHGGETILPTHRRGYGPTIIVQIEGIITGTESQVERLVRKAVNGALRHQGPNAFQTATGLRP